MTASNFAERPSATSWDQLRARASDRVTGPLEDHVQRAVERVAGELPEQQGRNAILRVDHRAVAREAHPLDLDERLPFLQVEQFSLELSR